MQIFDIYGENAEKMDDCDENCSTKLLNREFQKLVL